MFAKIIALCSLVAVCQAGLLPAPVDSYAADVILSSVAYHDPAVVSQGVLDEHNLADSQTGDNKSQEESDGDVRKGSYSFHEADGTYGTVEYNIGENSGYYSTFVDFRSKAAPTHHH